LPRELENLTMEQERKVKEVATSWGQEWKVWVPPASTRPKNWNRVATGPRRKHYSKTSRRTQRVTEKEIKWYEEPWTEWTTFRDKLIWIDAYNYEMDLMKPQGKGPVLEWLEKLEFDPDSTFEYPEEDFDDDLS
jgi:hypothetical protein